MKYLLLFITILLVSGASAQVNLYVSKSTGTFSQHSGEYSKTTDNYEKGNYTLSVEGPIKVSVTPEELYINPNETRSWTGSIQPDTSIAPPPGQSAPAILKYYGSRTYSRPFSPSYSDSEIIVNTYYCNGCTAHPGGGQHQIVTENGGGQFNFIIFTLGFTIDGPDCAYKGSSLKQTITGTPEGGTYEWKSLDPKTLEVTGNGKEGTVTCKSQSGTGTGKIEVTYSVDGVTHKETKEITFFVLVAALPKNNICDGNGVTVTLKPSPELKPVSKIKECISDIKIKYKPVVAGKNAKPLNIIKHTNINFSAVDEDLVSKADTVYWFISSANAAACDYVCEYEIWAEAINNISKDTISTPHKKLQVSVSFANCVNGSAHLLLDIPRLDTPIYKNFKYANGVGAFDSPVGPYPEYSVKVVPSRVYKNVQLYRMQGRYTTGKFKFSKSVTDYMTDSASQFFPLALFEEDFHTKQFAGQTNIPELKEVLSAQQAIDNTNTQIQPSVEFATVQQADAIFPLYAKGCWGVLIKNIEAEVNEYNALTAVWAKQIRCRLEQEAKEALIKQFGDIFTLKMKCAYGWCKFPKKK